MIFKNAKTSTAVRLTVSFKDFLMSSKFMRKILILLN